MNQKQKYKVFINDKSLVFGDAVGCFPIPNTMNPQRVPSFIEGIADGPPCFAWTDVNEGSFAEFCGNFKIIQAAGGLVHKPVHNEHKYLLIYRLGKWDLPKGKMDPGETQEQCAMREIEEECGIGKLTITGRLPDTWHMYQQRNAWVLKQTFWFELITQDDRTPNPEQKEHIERAEWMSRDELMRVLPGSYTSIADLLQKVFSGS